MAGEKPMVKRTWRTVVCLVFAAAACGLVATAPATAAKKPAAGKQSQAGKLDRGFGKDGKALAPFAAEDAGSTVKYVMPFEFTAGRLIMAPAPGGKTVVASSTKIVRFLANGKLDRGFGAGGSATIERPAGASFVLAGVAVDSQGRILVGGSARPQPASSIPDPMASSAMVRRFAANGSVDTGFAKEGTLVTDFGFKPPTVPTGRYPAAAVGLRSLVVDAQDRPLLTGGSIYKVARCTRSEDAYSHGFVARLTDGGGLDPSFGAGGVREIVDLSSFEQAGFLSSGALFAVGTHNRCEGETDKPRLVLASFGPEGSPNPSFGFAGFRAIEPEGTPVATVAPSGKIVLLRGVGNGGQVVTRLLPNGGTDRSFGRTGSVRLGLPGGSGFTAVAVDRQGRIVLAGRASKPLRGKHNKGLRRSTFLLGRLDAVGTVDRSFGSAGIVRTGFGGKSSSRATQVIVGAGGRILVGGSVSTPALGTGGGFALARYLPGR